MRSEKVVTVQGKIYVYPYEAAKLIYILENKCKCDNEQEASDLQAMLNELYIVKDMGE